MIQRRRGLIVAVCLVLCWAYDSVANSGNGTRGMFRSSPWRNRHLGKEVQADANPVKEKNESSTPADAEPVTITEEKKGDTAALTEATGDGAKTPKQKTSKTKKKSGSKVKTETPNESATVAPEKSETVPKKGEASHVEQPEEHDTKEEMIDTSTQAPTSDEATTKPEQTTEAPAATDIPEGNGSKTAPQNDDSDPCAAASTCAECVHTALTEQTTVDASKTCIWKDEACELPAADASSFPTPDEMCRQKATASPSDDDYYVDEQGGSLTTALVVLLFFMSSFMGARAYHMQQTGQLPAGLAWQPPTPRGQRSPSQGHYTERVPLASNIDDDEWGWEDSDAGGDVEMASRTPRQGPQQEDDDLQMALAISLSEKNKRSTSAGSGRDATSRSNSGGAWEERTADAPTTTSPRTSVGLHKVMPPTRKREEKPKKQKEQDDIFASMGLSAKPKFSKPSAPSRRAEAPTSGSLALAASDVDAETGSDWGDDADLDDLLED